MIVKCPVIRMILNPEHVGEYVDEVRQFCRVKKIEIPESEPNGSFIFDIDSVEEAITMYKICKGLVWNRVPNISVLFSIENDTILDMGFIPHWMKIGASGRNLFGECSADDENLFRIYLSEISFIIEVLLQEKKKYEFDYGFIKQEGYDPRMCFSCVRYSCSKCGAGLAKETDTCPECGANLRETVWSPPRDIKEALEHYQMPQKIKSNKPAPCTVCGTIMVPGQPYCSDCGKLTHWYREEEGK